MKKIAFLLKAFCLFVSILKIELLLAQADPVLTLLQPTATSTTLQPEMEQTVFNLINQTRVANNLPPLVWSPVAAQLARSHSVNMANGTVPFGHQGAQDRFLALQKAVSGTIRFGENVAYNRGVSNPAYTAVKGWLNSPGHYANIIGNYNQTGVGVARNSLGGYYFTQIFFYGNITLSLVAPDKHETTILKQAEAFKQVSSECPCEWEAN